MLGTISFLFNKAAKKKKKKASQESVEGTQKD